MSAKTTESMTELGKRFGNLSIHVRSFHPHEYDLSGAFPLSLSIVEWTLQHGESDPEGWRQQVERALERFPQERQCCADWMAKGEDL